MHDLVKLLMCSMSADNKHELAPLLKELLCKLIDHNCETSEKHDDCCCEKVCVDYYFLASEVSGNKSFFANYPINGTNREDRYNNTIYKLYKKEDNSVIGEVAAFYSRIPSFNDRFLHYSVISNSIILDRLICSPPGHCIFDKEVKRFTFPDITVETTDYEGRRVVLKKMQDDVNEPDKFNYRAILFNKK